MILIQEFFAYANLLVCAIENIDLISITDDQLMLIVH